MKHFAQKTSGMILLIFAAAACGSAPVKQGDSGLPANAKLFIKPAGHDQLGAMSEACASFNLNEAQVREIFKTYRKISKSELTQKYVAAPCYVDGLIETPKQVYSWRARAGNILETNYPSGKDVLLGGEPTKVKALK